MSTETLAKALRDFAEIDFDNVFVPAARLLEAQAAEIEALKADIATYVRAASEQATEIEALRKVLDTARREIVTFTFHLSRGDFADGDKSFVEQCVASCKKTRAIIETAMQTKEAS